MGKVEDDYLKIENSQVDLLVKSESFDGGGVTFLGGRTRDMQPRKF